MHPIRQYLNILTEDDLASVADEIAPPVLPVFKVGDWVSCTVTHNIGRIIRHSDADDTDTEVFYTVKWTDGVKSPDVPQTTLTRSAPPKHEPPAALQPRPPKRAPPPITRVSNVIKDRKPIVIAPGESAFAAAQLIARNNIGALPVLDGGILIGILSERDIVSKVIAHGLDVKTTPVAKIMTPDPVTITAEEPLVKALKLMHDGNFRHLPITSNGKFIGILSLRDAILLGRTDL